MTIDPYKILGIKPGASADEIRKAYLRMSKKYHPDAGGDAWAFQQVREAYEELTGSPDKRKRKKTEGASSKNSGPERKSHDDFAQRNSQESPNHSKQGQHSNSKGTHKQNRSPDRGQFNWPASAIVLLTITGLVVIASFIWFRNNKNSTELAQFSQNNSASNEVVSTASADVPDEFVQPEKQNNESSKLFTTPPIRKPDPHGAEPNKLSASNALIPQENTTEGAKEIDSPIVQPAIEEPQPPKGTEPDELRSVDRDTPTAEWSLLGTFEVEMLDEPTQKISVHMYTFLEDGNVNRNGEPWGKWVKRDGGYRLVFNNPNRGYVDIQMINNDSFTGLHFWKKKTEGRDKTKWTGRKLNPASAKNNR